MQCLCFKLLAQCARASSLGACCGGFCARTLEQDVPLTAAWVMASAPVLPPTFNDLAQPPQDQGEGPTTQGSLNEHVVTRPPRRAPLCGSSATAAAPTAAAAAAACRRLPPPPATHRAPPAWTTAPPTPHPTRPRPPPPPPPPSAPHRAAWRAWLPRPPPASLRRLGPCGHLAAAAPAAAWAPTPQRRAPRAARAARGRARSAGARPPPPRALRCRRRRALQAAKAWGSSRKEVALASCRSLAPRARQEELLMSSSSGR